MSPLPPSIVDPNYRHVEKAAYPLEGWGSAADRLKWYEVREVGREIRASVEREARELSARLVDAEDVGFVMLHLCGADFVFLIVCRWRNNNEVWETVYGKSGDAPFEPIEAGDTRPTFCVWELGVVEAERRAWTTFLASARTEADLLRYQGARFSGPV